MTNRESTAGTVASVTASIPLGTMHKPRPEGILRVWRGIRHSVKGMIGAGIVLLLLFLAVFGSTIAPYDPLEQDYDALLQPPSAAHWLGTDNLGRDSLSRLLYGAQISLQVGVLTVVVAGFIGVSLGLIAAQFRGPLEVFIMRITDGIMAFPGIILALTLVAVLGPSLRNVIIAIAFGSIPKFVRLARGQALSVGTSDYVTAAEVVGASRWRIILQHVWPNSIDPIIVLASLAIGTAIIAEAGLSFLGVGVPPPTPTWGWMLKTGYPFISSAPWVPMAPGMAIFITVLGFNLLGDAIRDALDPHIND